MKKTSNILIIALTIASCWFGVKAWQSYTLKIRWQAYEMGATRSAIYTLDHNYLPSGAFREVAFEMPDASDAQIQQEAERRYLPLAPSKTNDAPAQIPASQFTEHSLDNIQGLNQDGPGFFEDWLDYTEHVNIREQKEQIYSRYEDAAHWLLHWRKITPEQYQIATNKFASLLLPVVGKPVSISTETQLMEKLKTREQNEYLSGIEK